MRYNPENFTPIAEGNEKRVYQHPDDQEKVVAFLKESENSSETHNTMKGRFYLTKILHEFLPNSIPDIHMAGKRDDSYLVNEKIILDDENLRENELATKWHQSQDKKPNAELSKLILERRIKISGSEDYKKLFESIQEFGVNFDVNTGNLGYDQEDNFVYIDNSFKPWLTVPDDDTEQPLKKLYKSDVITQKAEELPERSKEKVLSYLNRLEALYNEELASVSDLGLNKIN